MESHQLFQFQCATSNKAPPLIMPHIVLIFSLLLYVLWVPFASGCDLYLTKSRLPGVGRGIFAGRNFEEDELLLYSPSLIVLHGYSSRNQLDNYVFSTFESNFHVISLNYVCIVNHAEEINVARYLHDSSGPTPSSIQATIPHIAYSAVDAKTVKPIRAGEELFLTYGGPTWFSQRYLGSVNYLDASQHETSIDPIMIETEPVLRHCISDVKAELSNLPLAGEGLFAQKSFVKGEIVSISPVLALSTSEWYVGRMETVLMNYCLTKVGSQVAFLPLGHLATINHASDHTANVAMAWFEWSPGDLHRSFNMSLSALLSASVASLDVQVMATRDIEVGEEITMNYGPAWLDAWSQYLAERIAWMTSENSHDETTMPIFRNPITAPDSMTFQSHWMV